MTASQLPINLSEGQLVRREGGGVGEGAAHGSGREWRSLHTPNGAPPCEQVDCIPSSCDGNVADAAFSFAATRGVVPDARYPYAAAAGAAGACRSVAAVPASELTRLAKGKGFTVVQPNSATALMRVRGWTGEERRGPGALPTRAPEPPAHHPPTRCRRSRRGRWSCTLPPLITLWVSWTLECTSESGELSIQYLD